MMIPETIISGGQTDTAQAALDVAIKLGIPHGSGIPKGDEMKEIIVLLLLSLALALSACSGNNAEALFETAKLEELQNAPDHAMKLYQEILDKYPESEYAQKAKERLSAMKGGK